MGLSFIDLTSAYSGTDPSADDTSAPGNEPYSPIMNTIFEVEHLTDAVFSLALNRDDATNADFGGVLAIGGLPDLTASTVNVTTPLVTTPMTTPNASYTIAVTSAQYGTSTDQDADLQVLIDSGTTLIYLPDASADIFNGQFNPPAVLGAHGAYTVACTATVPVLTFTIAGQAFTVNPIDLLIPNGVNCTSGVAQSSGQSVLGDVFLKNVLAAFDWNDMSIR